MYSCMYPDCNFQTNDRVNLDLHHIKPRELGGSNANHNLMWLCPTHHRLIYVPESNFGIHSIRTKDSIIVRGFINSTAGIVLHFVDCNDGIEYFYMYSKKLKAPAVSY